MILCLNLCETHREGTGHLPKGGVYVRGHRVQGGDVHYVMGITVITLTADIHQGLIKHRVLS